MYRWNPSMGCNNVGYVKCFILIEDLLYICVQISLMVNAAIWGILKNIMANTRIKKYIDDHISYNRLLDIFVFWLIFFCDNDYEYSSNEYPNRRQVYNKNYPLSLLIEIHSRQPQKSHSWNKILFCLIIVNSYDTPYIAATSQGRHGVSNHSNCNYWYIYIYIYIST